MMLGDRARVQRFMGVLGIDAGVGPGTPVVVVVGNDIGSVVAVHAALRIDAVVLLLPRSAGTTQTADVIARTGAGTGRGSVRRRSSTRIASENRSTERAVARFSRRRTQC